MKHPYKTMSPLPCARANMLFHQLAAARLKRSVAATLAACAALGGAAPLWADDAIDGKPRGKRIDNGRVDVRTLPAPGERQPDDFAYPLPSGVSRGDALAMRAAHASLPVQPPTLRETLSESGDGALFESGKADLTPAATKALAELAARHAGKPGLRLAVVGHTDDQRLSANARQLFKDNLGLSEARALAVADFLRRRLELPADAVAISGRGEFTPVASNATPDGMARNRRVEITVWHDANLPAPTAALVSQALPACAQAADAPDLPFRITVDGEDLSGGATTKPTASAAPTSLSSAPTSRSSTTTWPPSRRSTFGPTATWCCAARQRSSVPGPTTRPGCAARKCAFFCAASARRVPLAIVPLDWDQPTRWEVPAEGQEQFGYLLRVYDAQGRFDETALKYLNVAARPRPLDDIESPQREALTGWGENALAVSNIPVRGGTVSVSGKGIQAGERVTVLGLPVPVDAAGRFVLRQILPAGPHAVAVELTNAAGETSLFRAQPFDSRRRLVLHRRRRPHGRQEPRARPGRAGQRG